MEISFECVCGEVLTVENTRKIVDNVSVILVTCEHCLNASYDEGYDAGKADGIEAGDEANYDEGYREGHIAGVASVKGG